MRVKTGRMLQRGDTEEGDTDGDVVDLVQVGEGETRGAAPLDHARGGAAGSRDEAGRKGDARGWGVCRMGAGAARMGWSDGIVWESRSLIG